MLEMLERKGFFSGRSPVPVVRPKATDVKRRAAYVAVQSYKLFLGGAAHEMDR